MSARRWAIFAVVWSICLITAAAISQTISGQSGSGGTSSLFGSLFPTSGTPIGGTDGTNFAAAKVITTSPALNDPGLVTRNINPNLAADNSTNSTAKVPGLFGRANAADPSWTEGNQVPLSVTLGGYGRFILPGGTATNSGTSSGIAAPTASYVYSLNLCGGAATWAACAASGPVDAPNNSAAPANVEVMGAEASTQGSQPTVATTGNVARPVMNLNRVLYTQPGGPVYFTCNATGIAATLTQLTGCAAPGAGLSYYITSIIAQSNTSTAATFLLRYGTAANCGTGTTSIYPAAATTAVGFLPANTALPLVLTFPTPIKVPANNLVCVLGVATNTTLIDVAGYIAP